MTRLPTLQRRIARYLTIPHEHLSYDEMSLELTDIIVDYLNEQSYKKTEIEIKDFICSNSIEVNKG